jgi:hypothetical protein
MKKTIQVINVTEEFIQLVNNYLTGHGLADTRLWLLSLKGVNLPVDYMVDEVLCRGLLHDMMDTEYITGRIEWDFRNRESKMYNECLDSVLAVMQDANNPFPNVRLV